MKILKFSSILGLLFIFSTLSSYSQQTDLQKEKQLEELVESLAVMEDGTTESSLLLDDISYYSGHPIYINKATEEELTRLNFLNFKQVRSIITYRGKYGKILSLKELAILPDFSMEFLLKMEPFVLFTQDPDSMQKKWDSVIRQSLLSRIKTSYPVSKGFQSQNGKIPVYGGSPYSYFTRYRGEFGKSIEMGITAENDAGEEFFRKSNKQGFDFLSGFLCWNGKGLIRKIVVGDYHLRFGQGVNLWSGGGVSYASDLSSLMRTGDGIRPYSSSDENMFFRGAAVQVNFNRVKFSFFYSGKTKDANLEQDSINGNFITSFRNDGLHRTTSEMEDEKNASDRMIGGYSDLRFRNWRIGMLAAFQKFGFPVSKGNMPYKSKTFEGDANANFGLDYHLILSQISLFGEIGLSQNYKLAFINGMVWKAHPQLSFSFLYRNYDPSFQSFNSAAFANGSGGRNEEGFYAAFAYFPIAKVRLSGQADLFYFPWMTYQTISPAQGHTLAFQAEMEINTTLSVYLHGRFVQKPQKASATTGVPEQWDECTAKWRAHCDWKISEKLQLRSRIEYVGYKYQAIKEKGFLIFQDLIFTASLKLKCWYRLAYYSTDGYNSRVYSYENDLLYYFAIPEFHGKGWRSYINLKWQPCRLITLYFKGGYTIREGATFLGSGNDTTQGNHRFDVRGQVCLKF